MSWLPGQDDETQGGHERASCNRPTRRLTSESVMDDTKLRRLWYTVRDAIELGLSVSDGNVSAWRDDTGLHVARKEPAVESTCKDPEETATVFTGLLRNH